MRNLLLRFKPIFAFILQSGVFFGKLAFKIVRFLCMVFIDFIETYNKEAHLTNQSKSRHPYKTRQKMLPEVRSAPIQFYNGNKVVPDNTPLHSKRGWSKNENGYTGYYRTEYGAWKGKIIRRGDKFDVYIFDPPVKKIETHKTWACFFKKGKGKYQIHLQTNPKDQDIGAIIFYVEKIINESFRNSSARKEYAVFSNADIGEDFGSLDDVITNLRGKHV